jgi:hypothetical protein
VLASADGAQYARGKREKVTCATFCPCNQDLSATVHVCCDYYQSSDICVCIRNLCASTPVSCELRARAHTHAHVLQSLGTTAEAENRAKAHVNVSLAKTTEAMANRDLHIKVSGYTTIDRDQKTTEAIANRDTKVSYSCVHVRVPRPHPN